MTDESPELYDVLGSGAGGPLPPVSPWLVFSGYLSYAGGIVLGAPTGGNQGPGTINLQDIYINGQAFDFTTMLAKTGGTLTGPLIQAADPVNPLGSATKQYVDNKFSVAGVGTFLPLAGGTLTGPLLLNADPTTALGTATKQYVDGRTPILTDAPSNGQYYMRYNGTWQLNPGGITIPDAPTDGNTYGRNNGAWSTTFDAGTF